MLLSKDKEIHMKVVSKIYTILIRGFAICTAILLIMFLFARLILDVPSISLKQFLLILAFSLPLSLAHELYLLRRLPFIARLGLHYGFVTTCFTVLFSVVGKIAHRPATVFVWIVIFTLAYAVIAGIVFPILRATGYYEKHLARISPNQSSTETPYEKRFS